MLYPLSYGANADKDSGPGAAAARRQGSKDFRSLSRPLAAVSKGRWVRPPFETLAQALAPQGPMVFETLAQALAPQGPVTDPRVFTQRIHSNIPLVTELNLTPTSSCGCGGTHDQLPELDARTIPHAIRHASIHGVVDSLRPGASFVLVAPHDPIPLLAQIADRHGEAIAVEYVQRGPEAWKLKLTHA